MKQADSYFQETIQLQPFVAIQLNHFTRLRFFLKNGLNPNLRDQFERRTLLMCSCELSNEDTALKFVNLLLKYNARIAEDTDVNAMNALHYAVRGGHARIVARFLEFSGDFDVNARDNEGNTALMYAVLGKHLGISEQVIKVLRRYDLSVDIPNNQDITPLIRSTVLGQREITNCLIDVGKASEQIRDKHFRKSASEWERTNGIQLTGYPTIPRAIHSCPPKHTHDVTNRRNHEMDFGLRSGLPHELTSSTTSLLNFPTEITGAYSSTEGSAYKWPDLRRAYDLYEQELTSSYRRSVPPRPKTPPPTSSSSNDGLWRKTASAVRLRQRRHTIALSQSLPNNLSTRLLFSRRSIPNKSIGRRSFSLAGTDQFDSENSKWPLLKRRSSLRRQSDDQAQIPATAPAELESSSFPKNDTIKRRHSVSFQSLTIKYADKPSVLQSPGRMRRSNLKNGENTFASVVETRLPIFEHEEDLVVTDDDKT